MKLPRHYVGSRASTRFLLTTFLITWPAWWLNAALTSAGIIEYSGLIGTALHTIGVFGPTIAGPSLIPGGFTLKRGLAFTFGGLRRSLPWTAAFLVVPLVLLTAASDGLAEGFSPISAMGAFLFFAACLATGAIWGLWHLPLWFTQGAGEGDDPVSCVRSPRCAPLVLAVGALSRGRVRLLMLPSPCVGEHAHRGAFAFKHSARDGRGACPHGALACRFATFRTYASA